MRLWRHAGLDGAERIARGLPGRLAESCEAARRSLSERSLLHPEAHLPSPEMPVSFAEMLATALALEQIDPPAPERRGLLERNYLEAMPSLWVEQLATSAAPNAALFHTPLDWTRMPRLASLIEHCYALVTEACGDASSLGAPDAAAFRAARPTLAALYHGCAYGRFMPLLYAYPTDLAAMARALDAGATVEEVIDAMLSAPLAHELSHLGRGRPSLLPLYLDECIAAHLGARLRPETLWPAEGEVYALYGAPWLAQVGQALARTVGETALLRAHAGAASWSQILPDGLEAKLCALGWSEYLATRDVHFLSSSLRPEPWMKLFFLAAGGAPLDGWTLESLAALPWREVPAGPDDDAADRAILRRALHAVCVRNFQIDASFRVARRAPTGPITVDVEACWVSAAPGSDGCDARAPGHLFPPAVAARLRAQGVAGFEARLHDLSALPALAEALGDGAPSHRAPGYQLVRHPA